MASITVIVPVYRVEEYLDRCVRSILEQTWEDFELVLVDDGSPDRCGILCDGYARQDSRVKVLHRENGGLSAARNAGLDWMESHSQSQWVTFIDSDDWVHRRFLEYLMQSAVDHGVSISVCGFARTSGEPVPVAEEEVAPRVYTAKDFYLNHFVNATIACGKLYHRSCFASARFPLGKYHEDEFLTYRLLFQKEKLVFLPGALYAYYVNPQGITGSRWTPRRMDAWEAYEEQIAFFQAMGDEELVKFRYRGYIDNVKTNWQEATQSPQTTPRLRREIKKRVRRLLRRAWRRGYIAFWFDFDLLLACYPILTRLYRLGLEVRGRKKSHG